MANDCFLKMTLWSDVWWRWRRDDTFPAEDDLDVQPELEEVIALQPQLSQEFQGGEQQCNGGLGGAQSPEDGLRGRIQTGTDEAGRGNYRFGKKYRFSISDTTTGRVG